MTDRLQQAIKKARSERESRVGASRPQMPQSVSSRAPQKRTPVQDAWQRLTPLIVDPKAVVNNRLVAHTSGELAIPFDMLRTKVLQQAKKNNWRRVALVSPHSACGKSTIAANLGYSFSRMTELRTIVMDFDLRRMGLGRVLGQTPTQGMPDVLVREADFADVACCLNGNVAFGLNARSGRHPSEILQSRQTSDVLDEIERTYQPDVMLFDMPPLMANDDSHGFLRSVDCALLIVVAEKTPMEQIDVAERQLGELTNVMGIVLNRCRYTTGAHGYENEYY
ncbi:CpsD/CapB family tyrosine-protein kinase [Sedimentitalea nanhaiensis]|uniref:Chromosome partitioning ATPase, Mrp family, contains Fe-S cluster n=1 Tax=Sedimentitalea nanhaiensis TaxID=999627 RepID=A0A1I6X762_9RHOB|nr:CpsD/CapB family tyrosine-protein kinase [Sedimentitalea nanhaiensis]SFT33751.1 Chromosome partitioning ATPase, Mrp family, contains Fe-S cluster [Sedimentitalea nanhaiensis]